MYQETVSDRRSQETITFFHPFKKTVSPFDQDSVVWCSVVTRKLRYQCRIDCSCLERKMMGRFTNHPGFTMMPLLWLKRWNAPDALTALFHTTKTPWSFEPFVHLTEGQITQLKGMGNMSDTLQKSQYICVCVYIQYIHIYYVKDLLIWVPKLPGYHLHPFTRLDLLRLLFAGHPNFEKVLLQKVA